MLEATSRLRSVGPPPTRCARAGPGSRRTRPSTSTPRIRMFSQMCGAARPAQARNVRRTGGSRPRRTSRWRVVDLVADGHHMPGDLVAERVGQAPGTDPPFRPCVPFVDVQVGPADRRRVDADQDLASDRVRGPGSPRGRRRAGVASCAGLASSSGGPRVDRVSGASRAVQPELPRLSGGGRLGDGRSGDRERLDDLRAALADGLSLVLRRLAVQEVLDVAVDHDDHAAVHDLALEL